MKISFASDNTASVHPKILAAINEAAKAGFAKAYGDDDLSLEAIRQIEKLFGPSARAFLVFNGTGANVLGLSALLQPYECVLASETSHLNVDECGAFERFSGSRVLTIQNRGEKLRPEHLDKFLVRGRDQHSSQPRILTISQSTEEGQVYNLDEIRSLTAYAHSKGLLVHMDGARFANAVAALGVSAKEMTADSGIDVLSFGGTKNGLMFGEAVVFFNRPEAENFRFVRKQGLQLASKMRFLGAQFIALLGDDLWLNNARHANAMAKYLADQIKKIPGVKISYSVEANVVFLKLPSAIAQKLHEEFYFYIWNEQTSVVRLMMSYESKPEEVDALAQAINSAF